ncbi:vacuolar protein sorting-associated protein 13A-like [Limulus polyphemus]|uniref:Vacuolar protein sorting-associated protein 13A-like n=1 Tax=Limulus polyphemus TaxID=6850 RepID=A0ABM1TIG1_LIMPO|nr:vacuolar protein sorting-associated protein 13A-like [Limulus polyphemus]
MFESIVVDLLNRFLGDYVENLDKSQLKIAIWGGDIVLRNLDIKQNALDDLDLPVKVCSGHLGELVLKIPWKNIYSAPVTAIIDGLYVVITPNAAQKYNAEKEKKMAQEIKHKELERIEDAKAREAEKNKEKGEKQDTFTEKMVTQIIRNLQVKIMNIHIRYEDDFTNPACSFAVGVTLHGLFFETTDESWKPCVVPEAVNMFNKLVTMDSLGVYWNSNAELFSKMTSDNRKIAMIKAIASKKHKPIDNCYILGPITLTTKMTLNPKPESDGSNFCTPKIQMNIIIEDISVLMNKSQYHEILQLLESVDRLTLASMYRKYRPDKPHKGNAKLWWIFAVSCVLEEDVRRRQRNWSWVHMQQHRKTCQKYKDLYKQKLVSKKLSQNIHQQIDDCENYLDVFNITVVRRQAEVDISRNIESSASHSGRWFSSLFSGGKKTKVNSGVGSDIVKKFDETMTEQEKGQLYKAIGYQENFIPTEYPKTFVENKLHFQLSKFVISVRDDTKTNQDVLKIDLNNVSATFEHRPSAEAIKLGMQVKSFSVYGSVLSDGKIPHMIKVEKLNESEDLKLLQMLFETNPLDQTCDQRINVSTMPLEIIYDAFTINNLIEVFKPPQTVSLYQLQAAAAMKLEDFKDKSALGLQYAIEQHRNLDLNINIKPSYIIIPENGVLEKYSNILVINLGNFQVQTVREMRDLLTVKSLVKAGNTDNEILETMMTKAYDKFHISLQNVGVLLTKACNDWKKQKGRKNLKCCLLQPVTVDVNFMRAIITDDPRMPKVKISGELPLLNLSLSDQKLKVLMSLMQSIPFPESEPEVESKEVPVLSAATDTVHIQAKTLKQVTGQETFVIYENVSAGEENESETGKKELVQFIDLHLNFEIKRIVIDLSHQVDGIEKQMISFRLFTLGTSVFMRTFDMSVDLLLGGVSLEHKEYFTPDEKELYLLNTPLPSSASENLFTLQYLQADKKGPLFDTYYKSTIQSIFIRFTQLDIVLHQDALLALIKFASDLTSEMQKLKLLDKVGEYSTCSQGSSEGPTTLISEEKTRPLKKT